MKIDLGFSKKASEYSIVAWIPFLVLFFLLIGGFVVFFLWLAAEKAVTGEAPEIDVLTYKNDIISSYEFEGILNSEIVVNGKETSIFNAIKDELNGYFEIKNDDGENFVEVFGLKAINEPFDQIKNQMLARGFDEEDYKEYVAVRKENQEGEYVQRIVEELDKFCDADRWDRYLMEIPQGIVTKDGLKLKSALGNDLFYNSADKLNLYTRTLAFRFYHNGESFEIKYRRIKEC